MKSLGEKTIIVSIGRTAHRINVIQQERKTISLSVTPGLQIILKCPIKLSAFDITNYISKKKLWIQDQIITFKRQHKKIEKEFISGESVYYLGKQYRLKIKKSAHDTVVLTKNIIEIHTTKSLQNSKYNQLLLTKWYEQKISTIFPECYKDVQKKFDYASFPVVSVRKMKNRWGSFHQSGKILLNPKLIFLSKLYIKYILTHELCHVTYREHNNAFYELLAKKCHNWKNLKKKMDEFYN